MDLSETTHVWHRIRDLRAYGHVVRVESGSTDRGIPDVNYCIDGVEGWIELKYVAFYPKRPTTSVRLGHYTGAQQAWAMERYRSGGNVFLFLRVENDFYLFSPLFVPGTKPELEASAVAVWRKRLILEELYQCLVERSA